MKKLFTLVAAAMMLSASAGTVTVFDGNVTNEEIPISSRFMDWAPYTDQVIYSEADLAGLVGKAITSVTYYVANEGGCTLNGGMVGLYIGTTDMTEFPSYGASFVEGLTKVAEMPMTTGVQEIEFVLDEAWTYNGGNIIIQTMIEADGSVYGGQATQFLGKTTDLRTTYYGGTWTQTTAQFGPKTTFTFDGGDEPEVLRGDVNKDGGVNIADVAALIDMLLNNEAMIPEADCDQDGSMNIADAAALVDFLLSGVWE